MCSDGQNGRARRSGEAGVRPRQGGRSSCAEADARSGTDARCGERGARGDGFQPWAREVDSVLDPLFPISSRLGSSKTLGRTGAAYLLELRRRRRPGAGRRRSTGWMAQRGRTPVGPRRRVVDERKTNAGPDLQALPVGPWSSDTAAVFKSDKEPMFILEQTNKFAWQRGIASR